MAMLPLGECCEDGDEIEADAPTDGHARQRAATGKASHGGQRNPEQRG